MYAKILVGTDGSDTAAKAVDRAASLAAAVGARLTIVTAGRGTRSQEVVDAEAARVRAPGLAVDTLVVDADPVSALVDAARSGAHDLLVVGNKGMTGLSRFFRLGSVPNKISHHLPCNLLIVKTT
jgi:nucleotide-binding universal stress UspA family protein